MMLADSLIVVLILLVSFSIRLGYWYFPPEQIVLFVFGAPIIAIPIFKFFDLYRTIIQYVSFGALWAIVKASSMYALIWGLLIFMSAIDGVPRSVVIFNWLLLILFLVALRIGARWFFYKLMSYQGKVDHKKETKNVLIYGAGVAGIQLMNALKYSFEHKPIGFIDDSKELQGHYIAGMDVYSLEIVSKIIKKFKVDEILVALPSASRSKRMDIINTLEPYPVLVRMLPGVSELAGGKVSVTDLRKVKIKDLLGRDSVMANTKLLSKNIFNKSVMVTGAGGSIGSELCRQILLLKPKLLVLYEMSELALYSIEKELASLEKKEIDIFPILGNVNNQERLKKVFKQFKVETIYHAAAYKHVPMVEYNNSEGVDNNIFGTLNCSQAAIDSSVETFVLISTDKAVRPTNMMGATKRVAELILQALSFIQTTTNFTMVRFGNVLDSSGSVIPLFKKQIKEGGPVTVTDKDVIRYFMTITEAVELVIQAGAMGRGGDVFLLDMGSPISIDTLAKKMIRLSGLELKDDSNPNGDIEIKYIGLRPGEKLFEELLVGGSSSITENPLIQRAEEEMMSWDKLKPILEDLKKESIACNQDKIRKLLKQLVPGYSPEKKIVDILYK